MIAMATGKSKRFKDTEFKLDRAKTGIAGLDEMVRGGFVRNSTVLVEGGTGSGKTLFCLQYLHHGAIEYNEPGVFISFAESEEMIFQHGRLFGWDFKNLSQSNQFSVIRYQPHEIVKIIEEGGGVIRDTVEALGAKRLAIDSLTAYEMMFENKYKANESILSLLEILRKWRTTSLVTSESSINPVRDSKGRLGFLTDGILHLYYIRKKIHRERAIEIVKMRDTDHCDEIRSLSLDSSGLKVEKRCMQVV